MRPILVTGAGGQLARSIIEAGAGSRGGAPVIAIGRPTLDVTRAGSIEAAISAHAPGLVVNCAAYTAVDRAETDRRDAMAVNAEGAGAVAAACARHGISVIHLSTDYVFDGTGDQPYQETDTPRPVSVYGRTKLEGEARVAAACPEHIILRTAWLYSPFGQNFVSEMLRLGRESAETSVVDDQAGCPTYAPHLADAILRIAQRLREEPTGAPAWGVYHAAGTGATTRHGLAQEVFARAAELGGPEIKVIAVSTAEYPRPARRPENSRLDCSALKARFGIALPDWRDGVRACVSRMLASEPQPRAVTGTAGDAA